MMPSERWPLDFDSLQRGTSLPAEVVEEAVLVKRDDPLYRCKVLGLRNEIQRRFEERGDIVTVVMRDNGLRILTHPEQAEHAPKRERFGMRQVVKSGREGAAVDLAQLSDEQRGKYERWLYRNAFRLQQLRKRPPPELTG